MGVQNTPYIGKRTNTPFGSKRQSLYELLFAHPSIAHARPNYSA
jgi:hypothetical protein